MAGLGELHLVNALVSPDKSPVVQMRNQGSKREVLGKADIRFSGEGPDLIVSTSHPRGGSQPTVSRI